MRTTFTLLAILIATFNIKAQTQQSYPRTTGFISINNAIGTWNKDGFVSNFSKVYTVAFPFGVNILKSDKFGVSFEFVPSVRTENNIAKVSSVSFNPGAMFRFKHGFTFIGRMAFETSGRFGVTPVFNQVVKKGKDASMFVSVPFPIRFGNNLPASVGAALQVGVLF